eukprot:TRINITY_DN2151_c0_g1_i1.p1 TRINITY_DN2151_c0_g1~~TRINITY_DN2151_c0_g1_i1.p1  ORF type:complete len:466 (-),score=161.19 TRINITY_DN2151_c0_g1_i1:11-1255(-)
MKETKKAPQGVLRSTTTKDHPLYGTYFANMQEFKMFEEDPSFFAKEQEKFEERKSKNLVERPPLYFGFLRPLMYSFQNSLDWLQSGLFSKIQRPLHISEHGGETFLSIPNLALSVLRPPSPLFLEEYTRLNNQKPILFQGSECGVEEETMEHLCAVISIKQCRVIDKEKIFNVPKGWTMTGSHLDQSVPLRPARRSIFLTVIYEKSLVDEKTKMLIDQILSQIGNEEMIEDEESADPDKELFRVVEAKPFTDVYNYPEKILDEVAFLLGLTYFHGPSPTSLSSFVGDINSVLVDSVFTIALPTTLDQETSFVYQALSAGSIPIVLRNWQLNAKMGPVQSSQFRVPYPTLMSWNDLPFNFQHFYGHPDRQLSLHLSTVRWWKRYLSTLQIRIYNIVSSCFDPPFLSPPSLPSSDL